MLLNEYISTWSVKTKEFLKSANKKCYSLNLDGVHYHIENRSSRVNQQIDFYMIGNSVIKELGLLPEHVIES